MKSTLKYLILAGFVLAAPTALADEEDKSWWQLTKDYVSKTLDIASDESKGVGNDVADGSKELLDEAQESSGKLWEKSKEVSSDAWQDIKKGSKSAVDSAREAGSDLLDKTTEILQSDEKTAKQPSI